MTLAPTDAILEAVKLELERLRVSIDHEPHLRSVVIDVKFAKQGHIRTVLVNRHTERTGAS